MTRYTSAAVLTCLALGLVQPAEARSLPTIQLSPASQPRPCTTPGRLMAFLADRNPRLAAKFSSIAADYMRHGRDLGVRWDYAFFQMVVETNALKFTGDVRPSQNNFAGIGATGGGVKGEVFRTVSDGVRAHLQHLMIYAGIRVDDPVSDRTRKVQSWGILDKWRRKIRHPITFSDVGQQWAPSDRGYASDIQSVADAFLTGQCLRPDPAPEQLAMAAGQRQRQRRDEFTPASALGAGNVVATRSQQAPVTTGYKTINKTPPATALATTELPPPPARNVGTAKVAAAAGKFAMPAFTPPAAERKCRVWTASYGGSKATIIRSERNGVTNYTVLDVNPGRENAETSAYIDAYAKGGNRIGDFPSKAVALDKAFKLCPED